VYFDFTLIQAENYQLYSVSLTSSVTMSYLLAVILIFFIVN